MLWTALLGVERLHACLPGSQHAAPHRLCSNHAGVGRGRAPACLPACLAHSMQPHTGYAATMPE
eukprot:1160823-Pelagomonas_calceolata.AAC.6